jgi:hypothetical protein
MQNISFLSEMPDCQDYLAGSIHSAKKPAKMRRERYQCDSQQFNRNVIAEDRLLRATPAKVYPPNQPDQYGRGTREYQVQQQYAFEFLPFERELPGQDARCEHGYGGDCGQEQVVVGGIRKTAPFRTERNQVESHTGDKQGDGKMDQHYVLSMFRQDRRFNIKWIHFVLLGLVHDDFGCHFWMDRAVIDVCSRFGEGI